MPSNVSEAPSGRAARSSPTFVLDGLGLYNPRLAITAYPELREWLGAYVEVGRAGGTVVYQRR